MVETLNMVIWTIGKDINLFAVKLWGEKESLHFFKLFELLNLKYLI